MRDFIDIIESALLLEMTQPEALSVFSKAGFDVAGAEPDALAQAHRKLVIKHHPDRGGDLHTMQMINAAHDVLKKHGTRAGASDAKAKTARPGGDPYTYPDQTGDVALWFAMNGNVNAIVNDIYNFNAYSLFDYVEWESEAKQAFVAVLKPGLSRTDIFELMERLTEIGATSVKVQPAERGIRLGRHGADTGASSRALRVGVA